MTINNIHLHENWELEEAKLESLCLTIAYLIILTKLKIAKVKFN